MKDFFSKLSQMGVGAWLYTIFAAGIAAFTGAITTNSVMAMVGSNPLSPRQLGIVAAYSAVWAMAGVLHTSPLPSRKTQIALLPGVHSMEQVDAIAANVTGVPSPAVASAIIAATPSPAVTPDPHKTP